MGTAQTPTAQASSSYDWPTLAHDMARTGYTPVGPVGPYTKQWYRDFWSESGEEVADGYEPVAVHDTVHNLDLTYIGTATGSIYALNLANGATFWRYPAPGQFIGGILSSPTVVNGIVYVASLDGNVYALDSTNVTNGVPALLWKFSTGRQGGFWGTPAVTASGVYIGARDGFVYALDPATGAKRWEYNTGAPILMSPAVDATKVYIGSESMHAFALSQSNGSLVWESSQLAGQTFRGSYPVLGDSLVFFRTAPNDDPHGPLGEGEQVLAYAAGCTTYPIHPELVNDRSNISCFNWKAAATSPMSYTVESQAVTAYLSGAGYDGIPGRPQYETFFALSQATGQRPFIAPILWTAGDANASEPPVVDGNGNVWVLYRTYYSDYDEPNAFIMDAFGRLDPTTGAITIRNPNPNPVGYSCDQYSCANPWSTNMWMIGDETTAYSVAGNRLYTGGAAYGSMDLNTGDLQSVFGRREAVSWS
ncbi:MAG TPA: PQQ-binding-like beta-propeller repeat protein, partial [Chloroflexota bacterium]|nr:PQQ-binding-like beta-propeller repeat protein [Chloroflexota bacterium]